LIRFFPHGVDVEVNLSMAVVFDGVEQAAVAAEMEARLEVLPAASNASTPSEYVTLQPSPLIVAGVDVTTAYWEPLTNTR
jgi:hypothetical protein